MVKKRDLTPEEKEARRQRQLAILKIAREVCFEKMMKGEIPYFNFHYRMLWQVFQSRNLDAIEASSGQISLEDFLKKSKFSSRAISPDGYTSLVQNIFYCGLTVLRRIDRGYVFELTGDWAKSFPDFFDFGLESEEDKVEKMQKEWIAYKTVTDPSFCSEYYGENE
jgi:hypothetical protein